MHGPPKKPFDFGDDPGSHFVKVTVRLRLRLDGSSDAPRMVYREFVKQ